MGRLASFFRRDLGNTPPAVSLLERVRPSRSRSSATPMRSSTRLPITFAARQAPPSWGQPTAAGPQALSLTDTESASTLNRVSLLPNSEKAKRHVATLPSGTQNPRCVARAILVRTRIGHQRRSVFPPAYINRSAPAPACTRLLAQSPPIGASAWSQEVMGDSANDEDIVPQSGRTERKSTTFPPPHNNTQRLSLRRATVER